MDKNAFQHFWIYKCVSFSNPLYSKHSLYISFFTEL